ncbi:hypothetical protein O0I10_005200 [Lichtheimia ornata]|uniref:Uncharacterized protein n=1 Tax=Lichtheimia ornata TaxID=688661 RepID=A0AAD7V617_9FUNG|nr:uncharacterized protein O0I10_005200 [Lichtheimia ornata]KAJ8659161.1 hypothetical protein O0I10_005200 [Lichtheimia ornata]
MSLLKLIKTTFNYIAVAMGGAIVIIGIGYLMKRVGAAAAIIILLQVLAAITMPSLQPVIATLATLF